VLGFLVSIPDFIPSFEIIQTIAILVIYIIIIGLAYATIIRYRNQFHESHPLTKAKGFTFLTSFAIVVSLIITFILTSLSLNRGGFSQTFVNELDYPNYKVKIYIFDNSFIEPITNIKIKDKTWPVMKKIAFIENYRPNELKTWRNYDTLFFSTERIELRIDLKKRKATKIYLKHTMGF
jgi:hypothetical protein